MEVQLKILLAYKSYGARLCYSFRLYWTRDWKTPIREKFCSQFIILVALHFTFLQVVDAFFIELLPAS